MNPAQLLAHFDRISDAPEAIPRLRRFVLDLAVRGKLVEQDPKDEPASDLLKRIQVEKARLAREVTAKKEKEIPPLSDEDAPFQMPSHWVWSKLAEIGLINPRNNVGDDVLASFVPMTLISAEYGASSQCEVRTWGEIKSGFTHFGDGDVALAKITPCFQNGKSTVFRGLTNGIGAGTTELHVVRPLFADPNYLLVFLKCPHFIETGVPRMTGTAGQKRVSTEYFAYSPFPLPPLAEQHRIVAKVDELMALCDRLEAAQAEREGRRERLAAASLHRLNQPAAPGDPQAFREHTGFHLKHVPRLTTRPEHIKQIRQTILNLAFYGKLVPQRRDEGSGNHLLERLEAAYPNHRKLMRSHSQSRPSRERSIGPSRFEVPTTWGWASLEYICEQIADVDHQMPKAVPDGVPFISAKDLKDDGTIDFSSPKMISEEDYKRLSRKVQMQRGDIVYSRIGARLGKARLVDVDTRFLISYSCCLVRPLHKFVDKRYLQLFLDSALALRQAHKGTQSIGVPDLGLGEIKSFRIPIPPLAEQNRIVAKVEELMALCDQVEAQLTTAQSESRRLLESVLHEAINDSPALNDIGGITTGHSTPRPRYC